MSKEHAYAYEAGYRDGSIHYELEHCPACKNVADLQEALAENAKLRGDLEFANNECEKVSIEFLNLQAENARLRELVLDMFRDFANADYELKFRCGRTFMAVTRYEPRLRELGVNE